MGNWQSVFNYRQRRRNERAKATLTTTKTRLRRMRTNKSAKQQDEHSTLQTTTSQQETKPVDDETTVSIDGRTYQNINSKYYLPNDELEQDRMTCLHFVLKHCFDGNYTAPVRDLLKQPTSALPAWVDIPATTDTVSSSGGSAYSSGTGAAACGHAKIVPHILDIACGTGIWLMEMASEFPHAQFYGIDISAMYPTTIKPPNVHFLRGDVCESLPYPDAFFDYVHMSMVYNCFSKEDRKVLVREIKRVMKPGAYFECRDVEPHIRNAGPYTANFVRPFAEIMQKRLGVDVNWYKQIGDHMQNICEFVDIHHQTVSINFISSSPLSCAFHDAIRSEFESYRRFCKEFYHMDDETFTKTLDIVMHECRQRRSYLNYYMCWCRKPVFEVQKSTSDFQLNAESLGKDTPTINTLSTSYRTMKSFSSSKSSSDTSASTEERENERRDRENQSAINQFIHGYVE